MPKHMKVHEYGSGPGDVKVQGKCEIESTYAQGVEFCKVNCKVVGVYFSYAKQS